MYKYHDLCYLYICSPFLSAFHIAFRFHFEILYGGGPFSKDAGFQRSFHLKCILTIVIIQKKLEI